MLRSKSRSGWVDFGQRGHSSIFTRTISASRLCRGDALSTQIDSNALVSLERQSSKTKHSSEDRISRAMAMQQQQMGQVQEKLREMKERLSNAEGERNRALDDLRKMKQVDQDFRTLKGNLSGAQEELKAKDRIIESLKFELERAKWLEAKLAERDVGFGRLKEELSNAKLREGHARDLVSDHQRRIHELDSEVEHKRLSESKMFDLLASQTKKYEENKIELEEWKLEIVSLLKKIELLEASKNIGFLNGSCNGEVSDLMKEEFQHLKFELQVAKESLAKAKGSEKLALSEVSLLKKELKLATEAEEKSRKAMDDLALALKEVATEAAEAKRKGCITELELNQLKEETEKLKEMHRSTEERYKKLLDEAKKETELHMNTVDRLRLEAEESLLAWNGREMGFVSCIRKAEEESAHARNESVRLTEVLKEAQNSTMTAREETNKVRDILKQAISEANAAKAAAGIARHENSQLKDSLAEMEEALQFLSWENERLRINEAAANEKVEQLKQMLSTLSRDYKIHVKKHRGMKSPNTDSDKSEDEEYAEARGEHEGAEKAKAPNHGGSLNAEYLDHLDSHQIDDSDIDRQSPRRRRALFRKVGDLIMKRSFSISRKEPSPEPALIDSSILKT